MRLRSPVPADAQELLALLVERDIADIGTPDITLEDLQDGWRGSDFDLSADARVVEAVNGRIVGYAAMSHEVTMLVVVAPDHEGRGIGSRLRRWAEQRDRARGSAWHRQRIAAGNKRGRALLLTAGYRPGRSYWRLGRNLDDVEQGGSPPGCASFRPVDVDEDAAALHALNEVSFQASLDYQPSSFSAFRAEHLRPHDFDHELSSMAVYDGQPVGFLLARRWRERDAGFIDLLGVHPDHRTRGLATAMLQTAFAQFAAAGLREAQLGVASDNPDALRLYERSGMTERFRYDTYERPVIRIRRAAAAEAPVLEALQRRSSDVWEAYREQLAANPDAIELPQTCIDHGWVRVAMGDDETPVGFSVVIPSDDRVHELDGLFVEPAHMLCGVGRSLVEDAAARAVGAGAECLEVTAGPAQAFYERVGFQFVGAAQTRFGPAVRMRRRLQR